MNGSRENISRREATLFSFLVPGSGQWALGQRRLGAFLFLNFLFFAVAALFCLVEGARLRLVAGLGIPALFIHLVSIVDTLVRQKQESASSRAVWAAMLNWIFPGLGFYVLGAWFTGLAFFALAAGLHVARILTPEWVGIPDNAVNYFLHFSISLLTVMAVFIGMTRFATDHSGVEESFPHPRLLLGLLLLNQFTVMALQSGLGLHAVPDFAMRPTLEGPHLLPDPDPETSGNFPLPGLLLRGQKQISHFAAVSGKIDPDHEALPDQYVFFVDGEPQTVPIEFTVHIHPGEAIQKGDLWASTIRKAADRLLVNRWAYVHRRPARGDLVLVRTKNLRTGMYCLHPYMILRVAGLPGEEISIHPPALYANGTRVTAPDIFDHIANGRAGYQGFNVASPLEFPPPLMTTVDDEVLCGQDEYFLIGDHPDHAHDSRFFGAVHESEILGRVIRVAWPFDRTSSLLQR